MGSGCANTVSSKSACVELTSADCVIYQGDSIPLLGICCGDTISEVEEALINKLLTVLDGTGIVLSGVTLENAAFLKNLLGGNDKTLLNMVQLLVDSDSNLRNLITGIQQQLVPTGDNFQYDLKCLASSCCQGGTVTTDEIIQMLIDKYCDIQTILNQITDTAGNITSTVSSTIGNYIAAHIKTQNGQGITVTGTGSTTTVTLTRTPPRTIAIPYWGPLSNFNSSGVGLVGTDAAGWHIMNGLDGFPNWTGYAFAQTNVGMAGTLDARVNANALNLPDMVVPYGEKRGELYHTISMAELPAHNHTITDPGHTHPNVKMYHGPINWGNKNSSHVVSFDGGHATGVLEAPQQEQQSAKTGITINSTGSTQPHNNVPPTVYGVWIAPIN